MKLLGDLLTGNGWSNILVQSEVTTSGRAEAILKGSHVTRSRYVHQVTAAALHVLQTSAYGSYIQSLAPDVSMAFNAWLSFSASKSPQFQYWKMVQEVELLAMQFVRSLCEGNFQLCPVPRKISALDVFTGSHKLCPVDAHSHQRYGAAERSESLYI